MAFKEYIIEAMIRDLTVCQHLFEKIPEGAMDKRPREGMRSTRRVVVISLLLAAPALRRTSTPAGQKRKILPG